MLSRVQVVHPWTKEVITLDVESVVKNYVYLRWGMSGVYALDVRNNTIKSCNPAVRRKHPHCVWVALDIENVRAAYVEHMNPGKEAEFRAAYERHHRGIK
jgi:hypothetical protein